GRARPRAAAGPPAPPPPDTAPEGRTAPPGSGTACPARGRWAPLGHGGERGRRPRADPLHQQVSAACTESRKEGAPQRWSLRRTLARSCVMVRGRAGCQISPGLVARRLVYSAAVSLVAEMTGRLTRPDVPGAARFH